MMAAAFSRAAAPRRGFAPGVRACFPSDDGRGVLGRMSSSAWMCVLCSRQPSLRTRSRLSRAPRLQRAEVRLALALAFHPMAVTAHSRA
eukprot:4380993-Pyramimonas_sp.AAC.1